MLPELYRVEVRVKDSINNTFTLEKFVSIQVNDSSSGETGEMDFDT